MNRITVASFLLLCGFHLSRAAIQTSSGTVEGTVSPFDDKITLYLGIPYAKPPVGDLRFAPPQPAIPSSFVLDGSRQKPACMQPPHIKQLIYPQLLKHATDDISEDCLYLNLYIPKNADANSKLAIMVYLPGEGFDFARADQYDGTILASRENVIVVTLNYRLSIFGFMSTDKSNSNLGVRDIIQALKWLKGNAANIGGDASRVTLFGKLTGSMIISTLMSSPMVLDSDNKPFFSGAVLHSGVANGHKWAFENNPLSQTISVAAAVNCTNVDTEDIIHCLRQIPASDLLYAGFFASGTPWRLVVDQAVITGTPVENAILNKVHDIDAMLGTVSYEGSICLLTHYALHTPYYQKIIDNTLELQDYENLLNFHLSDYFKMNVSASNYAVNQIDSNPDTLRTMFMEFCGDLYTDSAVDSYAEALSKRKFHSSSKSKVYRFEFSHRPTFSIQPAFITSAGLGDDIPFVFGLLGDTATTEEHTLSLHMSTAWGNFAKKRNPNEITEDLYWPTYSIKHKKTMTFAVPKSQVNLHRYHKSILKQQSFSQLSKSLLSKWGLKPVA